MSIDTARRNCCFHGIYVLYLCWEPNVEQVSFYFFFPISVLPNFRREGKGPVDCSGNARGEAEGCLQCPFSSPGTREAELAQGWPCSPQHWLLQHSGIYTLGTLHSITAMDSFSRGARVPCCSQGNARSRYHCTKYTEADAQGQLWS